MNNTINIGIDLGTTNSCITRFENGAIKIFSNPQDYGRNTVPSVVGFKKDTIVVGGNAYRAHDVFTAFKRKMGSNHSYDVKSLGITKSPGDLSAEVLKQLKQFVSDQKVEAAVITVPASFDSIQSLATKKAATQAGIKQVVLLQEPIAAALAYANGKNLDDSKFLVYDLGGGTFDVALMEVLDGEIKVLDNEGNNFLGGHDFDALIVEKIVAPKMEEAMGVEDVYKKMKNRTTKLNRAYFAIMQSTEEAKISLSSVKSASITVNHRDLDDKDGNPLDLDITITRSEFEALIKEAIDETANQVKAILTRNSLQAIDVDFLLAVGGSTYIPYVKTRVEELLGVVVKNDIDPTTAIAIGAAYYASSKKIEAASDAPKEVKKLNLKLAYADASKEEEEFFSVKVVKGFEEGFTFSVVRADGGYNSGKVALSERFDLDLPLVGDAYNGFTLTIFDSTGDAVQTEEFGINSGFALAGQPLTEDVCIEIDDPSREGKTKLEVLFKKGTILPSISKKSFPINKKLIKGNKSDTIFVNVYEGDSEGTVESVGHVGTIRVTGDQLHGNVAPGSDIEIKLSIDESRTYTCEAYLVMLDQGFKEVFTPEESKADVELLKSQISALNAELSEELSDAEDREDYAAAQKLADLQSNAKDLVEKSKDLDANDESDAPAQLILKKRELAKGLAKATIGKALTEAFAAYNEEKELTQELVDEAGNDAEKRALRECISKESEVMSMQNVKAIDSLTDEINDIQMGILRRSPDFMQRVFAYLQREQSRMDNQSQAASLILQGRDAISRIDWDGLGQVNSALHRLLPQNVAAQMNNKIGF